MNQLSKGDKLKALWSDNFDKVTIDKVYEVKETLQGYNQILFKIENDFGEVTLPLSVRFEKVN